MSSTNCCRPLSPSRHSRFARGAALAGVLGLAVGVLLLIRAHGVSWRGLSPALFVLLHGVVIAAIAFVAGCLMRAWHRPAPGPSAGRACCDGSSPRPHGPDTLIRWPRAYDWFVSLALGGEGRLRRWLIDLAELKSGEHVLDVGCGTGTLLLSAAERVGPSGAVCGIDAATEMIAYARHKAASRGVALEVVEGSAEKLPYPDSSFDVIFCTFVLHHLPEDMRGGAIGEMRRVLRPGGRMVVADLRPPGSLRAMLSLVQLLHLRAPHRLLDVFELEPLLVNLGFTNIQRRVRMAVIRSLVATLP
jgi:demethylmenaquinone methyltransferase/2-methoxy-6-polyprenyl-1,4-benzoquinol methylase